MSWEVARGIWIADAGEAVVILGLLLLCAAVYHTVRFVTGKRLDKQDKARRKP